MKQALIGAGLGALAAYFLDPQMGNGRRIQLRDQTMAKIRRGTDRVEGRAQDVANRAYGMAHETGDAVRSAVGASTSQ